LLIIKLRIKFIAKSVSENALRKSVYIWQRYKQERGCPDRVLFKLAVTVHQCQNGRAPPYLSEHCIPVSSADTRRHLRSANLTYLPYRVNGSTLTAVGRCQLLARWPGTHSGIGIQRAAQTVLGVYFKRTCSRVTSASSALGVLNDYALYKSTHALTLAWPRHYTIRYDTRYYFNVRPKANMSQLNLPHGNNN